MADRETFVANAAESTLTSALTDSSTTVNVAATTAFPSVPFYVTIDPGNDAKREVVRATAKTATTLTVVRGESNTTGVAHDPSAVIACVPVEALWTDINDRADAIKTTADAAYRPGGTDVAVADGGTGASTAATARTNLGAVGLTGDETVAGVKTFSSSPIVPAPTTDLQPSTKKYVDDTVSIVQVVTAQSTTVDSTTATTAQNSSLSCAITPLYADSLLIIRVDGEVRFTQTGASVTTNRLGWVGIYNSTDAVELAEEFRGRALVADSTEAAASYFPISLVGHYTVSSTTARTFVLRFRSASAQVNASIRGDTPGGVRMTIMEVRQ